jgi:hypothetical protein
MAPGKFDLAMYRGDSHSWRFVLWKDDAKTQPLDLTDAKVESEIKDKIDGTAILPLPCVVTLPNTVDISMNPSMYQHCPMDGVWDLQVTFPDAQVHTPIAGEVKVTADVTGSSGES